MNRNDIDFNEDPLKDEDIKVILLNTEKRVLFILQTMQQLYNRIEALEKNKNKFENN